MKRKKKQLNATMLMLKAAKKQSREEEIKNHGKPINYLKIAKSKKIYNKKNKAETDEALPYL